MFALQFCPLVVEVLDLVLLLLGFGSHLLEALLEPTHDSCQVAVSLVVLGKHAKKSVEVGKWGFVLG